jgi:hypothetical protein
MKSPTHPYPAFAVALPLLGTAGALLTLIAAGAATVAVAMIHMMPI